MFKAGERAPKVSTIHIVVFAVWALVFKLKAADVLETVDVMARVDPFLFKFLGKDVDELGVMLDRDVVVGLRQRLRLATVHRLRLRLVLREPQLSMLDLLLDAFVVIGFLSCLLFV